MKRIFEWIGGFALIAFSFYFTDQVSLLVATKSDLMKDIESVSAEYEIKPVDAKIDKDNNTIIPGKNGRRVNDKESYIAMKDFGAFNENYLIFDKVKPKESLEDNKDKFITSGNRIDRVVSIIVDNNDEITKYLNTSGIKYDLIIKSTDFECTNSCEIINGASDKDMFKTLNSEISGKKICIKDYSDINSCLKYKYYIIKPGITLNASSITEIKNQVTSGELILISSNAKLEHVKVLLNEIKYKDLSIGYVSDLIKEETE